MPRNNFAAGLRLKRVAICSILFFFVFTVFSSAQDKIVAIVNDDVITQKDLNDFINFMRVELSTKYTGKQLESKIQSMKLDLLDKLIEDRLILQEAKRNKINVDESRVKARVDEIRKHYASDSEFQKSLSKQGLVEADLESKIREQSLMYNIVDSKIRSKIIVNPGEVTDFYRENIEKLRLPEEREFDAITIDSESLAQEAFGALKNSQKLEEVINRYALSVNKFNTLKDGQLRKDIEEAVSKLNLGETSPPIKIEDKYYIFKLDNIIPGRQQTLSEVQDEIYKFLYDRKMQEQLTKWLDALRGHAYIKILKE